MMCSLSFALAGLCFAYGVDGAGFSGPDTGVRRVARNDMVEVTAVGPVQRQIPNENSATSLSEKQQVGNAQSRCQIGKNTAPALGGRKPWLGNGEYTIQSYEKIAGAQECALLCASEAKCKTFYHVKDTNHMLFQQCTLTSWAGDASQFTPNDCCDSGFPCSTDDLMELEMQSPNATTFPVKALQAPRRHRHQAQSSSSAAPPALEKQPPQDTMPDTEVQRLNHALEMKQRELAKKDIEIAHGTSEVNRLHHAIDIRQHMMVAKDIENAQGKSEVTRLNHALAVRQNIFVEKDMNMVEEKQKEAQLQAELNSLNDELTAKTHYTYVLASALVVILMILVGLATYMYVERRNALPAWFTSAAAASKQKAAQGNIAQSEAQTNIQ